MNEDGSREATLFTPFSMGALQLPHRIVMAPMTRNRAGPKHVPQPMNAEYYAQRASAALIISEATQVSPQGVGYPGTPGTHSAAQVQGWRRVTDAVHRAGGRIFLQLWHVGRISHPSLQVDGQLPVAPSAVQPAGEAFTPEGMQPFVTPRALAIEEIDDIIQQFRGGARHAHEAGFDGVEIHAANGYLLDQFLRDGSNRRDDAYGGEVARRAQLLLEVTDAVCDEWGASRVGVRLSPLQPFNDMYDSDPRATFSHVVEALNEFGLAYLHVTEMGVEQPGKAGPAFDLGRLRELWEGPYMLNGGYDRERAVRAVAEGAADLIAFGTAFLANPDLPRRLRQGTALNEADPDTFYGGGVEGYTDYPALESAN